MGRKLYGKSSPVYDAAGELFLLKEVSLIVETGQWMMSREQSTLLQEGEKMKINP